jgi:NADPH2:quinone reductase
VYPIKLPSGVGSEAAGTVLAVGPGVVDLAPGDRVAYAAPPPTDAYSTERLIDARWLVKLPPGIDDESAAAMMLKGLTSWYLLKRTYPVQRGDWILLYAAAGGVGSLLGQWAQELGVRVIGVVGTAEKRKRALEHGCNEVLLADGEIVKAVREITHGEGVAVVYDSVGRDTFLQSLDCLRRRGLMVSFGASSGPVPPFTVADLAKRGSLYVTRPTLFDYIALAEDLRAGSSELFALVAAGKLRVDVNQRYSLRDAKRAHEDLQARRTTGSTVLLP